jgi:uncharacterized membrane protein
MGFLGRLVRGHVRSFAALAAGLASLATIPATLPGLTRAIIAWDAGALVFLVLVAIMFGGETLPRMPRDAEAQQEGEWTIFSVILAAIVFSFAAVVSEFSGTKDITAKLRDLRVALVAATLLLSWLVTQALFALRYAHEYYTRSRGAADVDGGLEFPGEHPPDYWDFAYFSLVLGMTFQVSDVQITSRKLRRLATLHGFLGFVFNTVILALTINLASGLL